METSGLTGGDDVLNIPHMLKLQHCSSFGISMQAAVPVPLKR
jgi:hypothetical protein